jgi:cutinase
VEFLEGLSRPRRGADAGRLRMSAPRAARFFGVPALTIWALQGAFLPSASAQPCSDVQVLFARGTGEPAGVGQTGQAFIDSLRSRVGGKSLDVYPVNYPASHEWSTGLDGITDASTQVESMAANCPNTKMVLGGYSQGAAVMGFVTSTVVPDGVDPVTVPKPLTPEVANHIAAVVLYGLPNVRAMDFLGQPPVVIGPTYAAKTIQVCAPEDPVCSDGLSLTAHRTYASDASFVGQGSDFAAGRLATSRSGAPIDR